MPLPSRDQQRPRGQNRHYYGQYHYNRYMPTDGRVFKQRSYNYYNCRNSSNRPNSIPNRYTKYAKKRKEIQKSAPFRGTEEYTMNQIRETSDMIMRELLLPVSDTLVTKNVQEPVPSSSIVTVEQNINQPAQRQSPRVSKTTPSKLPPSRYNVEEIHSKIVNHLTKLKHGKKVNLICATSSGYDSAIEHIQIQQRLRLSKALRAMCSNQTTENNEFIKSIIPDLGINLNELPLDVIKQLSTTLDVEFVHEFPNIKSELIDIEENLGDCFFTESPMVKAEAIGQISVRSNLFRVITPEIEELREEPTPESEDVPVEPQRSESPPEILQEPTEKRQMLETTELPTKNVKCDVCTQTDPSNYFTFNENVSTLSEAIVTMQEIDQQIENLTKIRQTLFMNLNTLTTNSKQNEPVETNGSPDQKTLSIDLKETILVIKLFDKWILAASESGRVHYIDAKTGQTLEVLNVCTVPITCICIHRYTDGKWPIMYLGSHKSVLREYVIETRQLVKCITIGDSVQCIEEAWNHLFIGTSSGFLKRYSLENGVITFDDKVANDAIFALRPTLEGTRRVLLVATRNSAVCIRDAMSGLHMRTLHANCTPTVYSLLLENSLVYCGTSSNGILVYNFHDGMQIDALRSVDAKGIGCMRAIDGLIYAACHDGHVYVYDLKMRREKGRIRGPGGVILSMEILGDKILLGTLTGKFESIPIPQDIRS